MFFFLFHRLLVLTEGYPITPFSFFFLFLSYLFFILDFISGLALPFQTPTLHSFRKPPLGTFVIHIFSSVILLQSVFGFVKIVVLSFTSIISLEIQYPGWCFFSFFSFVFLIVDRTVYGF